MFLTLFALAAATAEPQPLPAFLAGCWEQRSAEGRWTEECWTGARGGLMIGSGREGKGDTVRNWEWMRIERGSDGAVTFFGSPKGAPAVGFRATEASATAITFVNAGHDYPQRVRYEQTADGLNAEVSLSDGSKANKWTYRRSGNPAN
jgi:hypothetical protein